jgi:hypothetical protein
VTKSIDTDALGQVLAGLLSELVDGPPSTGAYMLNRGDPGALASLERLDWRSAAATVSGGASIAAHVDHLRYALSLVNRYARGESDVFRSADWGASWKLVIDSEAEWTALRGSLEDEVRRWIVALDRIGTDRSLDAATLREAVASIAHFAYHLGAIRQIDRSTRGPSDEEVRAAR